jgi:chromosome segregation ATPase
MTKQCIVCGSRYGREHLPTCPRFQPTTRIDKLEAEITTLRKENEALQEQLDDWQNSHSKVINEQCAGDEKHCTCVPSLRKEVTRLQEKVKELEEKFDTRGAMLTHSENAINYHKERAEQAEAREEGLRKFAENLAEMKDDAVTMLADYHSPEDAIQAIANSAEQALKEDTQK